MWERKIRDVFFSPTFFCLVDPERMRRRLLPLQRSGRVFDDAMLLWRLHRRPVNRDALRRRQAGVLWRRAEIRRLGPALLGGRIFIAEEPGINHPENPGEKDGRRQKEWPWAINNAYTETKNRQEHRQAEEDHLCPTANAFLALGRLAASKRVQSAGRNAVAREQIGRASCRERV